MYPLIIRLALQSDSKTMTAAARFFENELGSIEQSIHLYYKAGKHQKALLLAKKTQDYESLAAICKCLD